MVRKGDTLTHGHYLGLPTLAELLHQKKLHTAVAGAKPVALLHDRIQYWVSVGAQLSDRVAKLVEEFPAAAVAPVAA